MSVREQAVVFDCDGARMVGIATQPDRPSDVGVLILVGGRQCRTGSHRQFTLLARRLAGADYCSFRFDFRGMGDSEGERRSFEALDADIAAAVSALRAACPSVRRVVLWGLCDAATAAALYWQRARDPLVVGLCLANPWLRSEESLARTRVRHYYTGRVADLQFWRKLLRGNVRPLLALREYLDHWRVARRPSGAVGFRQAMLAGLEAFPGPILLLLSGRDLTASEFVDSLSAAGLDALLRQPNIRCAELPGADHTFSQSAWQHEAEEAVVGWLSAIR
ncbi:MAG: hydrolase 1, exosortase A system-associated [Rhodocyclaceae bacterium]|nr:hydrolase 1, exosortase A system-associated [Rhodocyclaceae bacterium]